jgi:hypothetical protein
MDGITSAHLDDATPTTTFLDGSTRKVVTLPSVFVGKGVYRPGWRWSTHVGAATGKESERHIGYVLSGGFVVVDRSGGRAEVGPGDAFEVGPGADAWVVGDEPCIALDFEAR